MAQKDADEVISNNERNFVVQVKMGAEGKFWASLCVCPSSKQLFRSQALAEDIRVDGRKPFEYRDAKFQVRPPLLITFPAEGYSALVMSTPQPNSKDHLSHTHPNAHPFRLPASETLTLCTPRANPQNTAAAARRPQPHITRSHPPRPPTNCLPRP